MLLGDILTSHGLQVQTAPPPILLEVNILTVGGQQLWSNVTEPRSKAFLLNMRHCKLVLNVVHISDCVYYSFACAIPDPDTDTLVITGGGYTETTVSVYSDQGWQEDLPDLINGRYWHACAGYTSGGKRVK